MRLFLLWFGTYGRVGLIVGPAWLLGFPLIRRIATGPLGAALSVITGIAVLTLWSGLLLLLGGFRIRWLLVLVAAGVVGTGWTLRARLPIGVGGRWPRRIRAPVAVVLAVLGAALAEMSLLPLYPWLGFDSEYYHLPLAADLVAHRAFSADPARGAPFLPQANEAFFAVSRMFGWSDRVAHGMEFSLLVLTVAAVTLWFLSTGRGATGAFAAGVLVLASPIVVMVSATAYVDTWGLLFVAAGLVVGAVALEGSGAAPAACACGLLLGTAGAGKYNALAMAGLVVVALTITAGRRALVPMVVAAAVAVAPWYLNTLEQTHDPLYPFLARALGTDGPWTAQEIARYNANNRTNVAPGLMRTLREDARYLRGEVPADLPAGLPPLDPIVLAGLAGVVVRVRGSVRAAAAGSAAVFVAAWIWSTPEPRYVVPVIGPLAIAGGLVATDIRRAVAGNLRRAVAIGGAPVLGGLVLLPSLAVYRGYDVGNGPPPTGATEPWIAQRLPCLAGVEWLNRAHGSAYTVYGVHCEVVTGFAKGRFMGQYLGPTGYYRVLGATGGITSPAALAAGLRSVGAGFVLLSDRPAAAGLVGSGQFSLAFEGGGSQVLAIAGP